MVDSYIQPPQQSSPSQAQIILETLTSLSYRDQGLKGYLYEITIAVSQLLGVDWSVVTCCDRKQYQVLASNIEIQFQQNSFHLHGSLTGTVVKTGTSLCVKDTDLDNQYGIAPPGPLAIAPTWECL